MSRQWPAGDYDGGHPLRLRLPAAMRALAVRNFRLFLGGQLFSLTGRWMLVTGQDWLVIQLGGHGVALGITTALQFAPVLMFSLWAGVVADRRDKRRLLLVTQSSWALIAVLLAVLTLTGAITLALVFLLAFALGTVNALDTPVRQSFVVEMVGPADVANAVALNSVCFNSARIVGPSVAGLLIASVGTGPVFVVTAVSMIGVLSGLVRMRVAELHPAARVARGRGQLVAGFAYVRSRPDLALAIGLLGVVSLVGLNFPVTLALMAREDFSGGAQLYGAFSSALAVGAVLGALAATRRGVPRQRTLVAGAAAFGVCETVAALMPTPLAFGLALVATGAAQLTLTTTALTTVQLGAGDQMRGRVMAIYLLVFLGTTPIGGPLVGALCEGLGPRAGLLFGGVTSVLAAVVAGALVLRANRCAGVDIDLAAAAHLPGWATQHLAVRSGSRQVSDD